jgi:hypothetical protein
MEQWKRAKSDECGIPRWVHDIVLNACHQEMWAVPSLARVSSLSFHHSASYSFAHAAKRLNFLGKGRNSADLRAKFRRAARAVLFSCPRCDLFMALVTPGLFSHSNYIRTKSKKGSSPSSKSRCSC